MKNSLPEVGGFFQRDRSWHPPAFAPGYRSSVVRSPQRAPISFANTLSEATGPVFGHAMLGELDHDLTVNYAKPGESAIGPRIIVYGRDNRTWCGKQLCPVKRGRCRSTYPSLWACSWR